MQTDTNYRARFESLTRQAADEVEAAAFELATRGRRVRVYHQGQLIDQYRQPDSEMIRYLLTRLHPRYKPNAQADPVIEQARMAEEIERLRATLPGGKRAVTGCEQAAAEVETPTV